MTTPTGYGARLSGIGAAQPPGRLTGTELGARVGRSADWIEARTGIREIRVLSAGAELLDLALLAGRDALAHAPQSGTGIDLVIAASCSQRGTREPLSARIARALAPGAATLDVNAACGGFCYSIATADALIRSGAAHRALVVAAEHMTGIVDPADAGTSIIFGDGAGAVVLDRASDDGLYVGPVVWGSDGTKADLIAMPDGAHLAMAGQHVFRWAIEEMQHVAAEACRVAGLTPADIELFVPHQANDRIIDALTTQLQLEHAVVSRDVRTSGNTSAASIPIALTKLVRDGAAQPGQIALAIGFGAGLTYAAQVIRVP